MGALSRFLSVFACLCLAASLAASAQQSINLASISGRVTDPTGAAIPGATVSVLNLATQQEKGVQTDAGGNFHLGYLTPGNYQLTARHIGFADAPQKLTLAVGAALALPISLHPASQQTEIVVEATAPVLEAARTQVASEISQQQIRSLPVPGRDVLSLALLQPGVTPAQTNSTQTFAETSAVPGQGISIGSQRNFSNSFIVDGLSANDDAAGLNGNFYDQDVVDQFQVVSAGGQAEFGRALGGYVNLVTRGGTDTLHGDFYGYLRNQRLDAANPLLGRRLPRTEAQFGASLGGPLGHHATYYFLNFEQRQLNQDGLITISPANVAAINSTLATDGYAGPSLATGLYSNPIHSTNVFARLDKAISDNDQFNLRYSLYHVFSLNSRGVGALSTVSAAAGLRDDTQNLALSNIRSFSAATVNETRAQITYDNLVAPLNDAIGPAVTISGVASFGTLSVSPTARRNWLFELVDNLSHQSGNHSLKTGVDFLNNTLAITFPHANRGSYSFASLAAFQAGQYNNSGFTQAFGAPLVKLHNPNLGLFAQDAWTVRPDLTLDFGVRYDLQWLPTVATNADNVSPRLGFAWVPFKARHTVVRGGWGVYYDRIPLRALANAVQSSQNTTLTTPATFINASLSPGQTGAPVFPQIMGSVPAGVLVNFTTLDPHIQNAYSQQTSLQVEQQIGIGATVAVGGEDVRGRHLIIDVNQNPPTCVANGGNNGCRTQSAYGNNMQYSSLAQSRYDALDLTYTQQFTPGARIQVAYTWAKAYDDVGQFFFSSPTNNFDIYQDWARSDDDLRHRLTVAASFSLPYRFAFSTTATASSAPPLDVVTGGRTLQGTTQRPVLADGSVLGRNAGQGFAGFDLDARLSRDFALGDHATMKLMAEAFNLFNHPNNLIPNSTFGNGVYPLQPLPAFGQPTAVSPPRSLQLGLRVAF
jgi:hypothetical protein